MSLLHQRRLLLSLGLGLLLCLLIKLSVIGRQQALYLGTEMLVKLNVVVTNQVVTLLAC